MTVEPATQDYTPTGEKLKEIIRENGFTIGEVAIQLNMTRNGLDYHLQEGRRVQKHIYEAVKKIIGKPNYVMDSVEGRFYPIVRIRLWKGEVQMDTIEGYYFFMYQNENCFCIRVMSHEMENEDNCRSIQRHEIALVDKTARIFEGDVVLAVLNDGRQMIRGVRQMNGEFVEFESFNLSYPRVKVEIQDIVMMHKIVLVQSPPKVM